jgi:hypothetical protein
MYALNTKNYDTLIIITAFKLEFNRKMTFDIILIKKLYFVVSYN